LAETLLRPFRAYKSSSRDLLTQAVEGVKKSSSHVIPSEARNLHLFVFREINADASLPSA
jgi:hypothetical protein